jgi:hypothetical protein
MWQRRKTKGILTERHTVSYPPSDDPLPVVIDPSGHRLRSDRAVRKRRLVEDVASNMEYLVRNLQCTRTCRGGVWFEDEVDSMLTFFEICQHGIPWDPTVTWMRYPDGL